MIFCAVSALPLTMLCLGDSYTIGEAVMPEERFCNRAVEKLKDRHIEFSPPEIIAKTGWTTDELSAAIQESKLSKQFDFVTLLIGVNNQYRGRTAENFKEEFTALLSTAIRFAGGNKHRVIVISIPDWGATPFIAQDTQKRTREEVAAEIDAFNEVKESVCKSHGVHFISITQHSRKAKDDRSLIAEDGLHPSGKMYENWAQKLADRIEEVLR